MRISLEMPEVGLCSATACAYNLAQECHAGAITVGDRGTPVCDTFFGAAPHIHDGHFASGVGPCKVMACRFNHDLACLARVVDVGRHGRAARCLTFEEKAPRK